MKHLKKISTELMILAGILIPSALLAAGDRVWINNQTGQPLVVRDVIIYNMNKGNFYHNEIISFNDPIPTGKIFHFALVNWVTLDDIEESPGLTLIIGSRDWKSYCHFGLWYQTNAFFNKTFDCKGFKSPSLHRDGETSDGIVDWTYTITY